MSVKFVLNYIQLCGMIERRVNMATVQPNNHKIIVEFITFSAIIIIEFIHENVIKCRQKYNIPIFFDAKHIHTKKNTTLFHTIYDVFMQPT